MILTGVGIIRGIGPSPTPTSPLAVAVGNMSGSIGIVNWYSTNVSNWVYSAMASNYLWRGVEWSPNLGLFCVTGADNTFILTSPDGINWTSRTLPSGTPNFNSIAWSPPLGLFCIVGNSGYVCTSSDGITWTTGSSGNSWAWQDICWSYSLNRFAAVGSSGPNGAGATFYSAMYSTDGITWVNPSTPYNTVATINYGLSVNAIASN